MSQHLPQPKNLQEDPLSDAVAEIFSRYLEQVDAGEDPDFQEFCNLHPDFSEELKVLHQDWRNVLGWVEADTHHEAVLSRLRQNPNSALKPDVSASARAERDPSSQAEHTSSILARLAAKGPKGHRFALQGEVARGGMGAILKVWDPYLRRNLAMKVMLEHSKYSDTSRTFSTRESHLSRFLEEAQITGQLDHPGIVPIHELGLDSNGRVFFTMPLVKGQDFKSVIKEIRSAKGKWSLSRGLGVVIRVCQTMAYAHSKGVIHRDLKPRNVMVGRFGETYVMDWGLAKVLGKAKDKKGKREDRNATQSLSQVRTDRRDASYTDPESPLVTLDGDVLGTPAYMSPEQARGMMELIGRRSDIYAVGCILYHLLSGMPPYLSASGGLKHSPHAILNRVLDGPPKPLHEVDSEISPELVSICDKAMARDMKLRYASMEEMAEDLQAYLDGRVVRAYQSGAAAEFKKWVRRNRATAVSLSAVAFLLVGSLAVILVLQALWNNKLSTYNTQLLNANSLAKKNESLAKKKEDEAIQAHDQVMRLADAQELSDLVDEATLALWPPIPSLAPKMRNWLDRAEGLAERLPVHEETLATLRQDALDYDEDSREFDRLNHPLTDRLFNLRKELQVLEQYQEQYEAGEFRGVDPRDLKRLQTRLAFLQNYIPQVELQVATRRTWRFADQGVQWHHNAVAALVDNLRKFRAPETGGIARMRWRLQTAETVYQRSIVDHAKDWEKAIASIQSRQECPMYDGLVIKPQIGLVPLGQNPFSKLWEFAHITSGEIPRRRPDGEIVITEDSGIVFVLLPAGQFDMGAEHSPEESANNQDRYARWDETPIHSIKLRPFFLAKYEMTQGQWERMEGNNPSFFGRNFFYSNIHHDLTHPVERVSWYACNILLENFGLSIPTEAQWEYAARASSTSIWWPGNEVDSLKGRTNLADVSAASEPTITGVDLSAIEMWPDHNDGYAVHAPVGSFVPNKFGLYDIHGNVREWCRDGYGSYNLPVVREGMRQMARHRHRHIQRGGSFRLTPRHARSAARAHAGSETRDPDLGIRPSRVVRSGN